MPEFIYLRSKVPVNISEARKFLRSTNKFFAVMNRNVIISEVQIEAALEHVRRNEDKKVRDNATLLMLFVSGTSQISKAYELAGITPLTREFVVIFEDSSDMAGFRNAFPDMVPDETIALPHDLPDKDDVVFGNISRVELELA